jgi:hypothetical protein
MNYLATYFYQDQIDVGASYGNIFSNFEERNLIYWKTIYVFFSTSFVVNKNKQLNYIFFTNQDEFPYKDELESMGVEVISGLKLTNRNDGSWATVKFFFDVLNYITVSDRFLNNDNFILLDTDVVSISDCSTLFEKISRLTRPLVYEIRTSNLSENFHGLNLKDLNGIYYAYSSRSIKISSLIGGEFFGINKLVLKNYISEFNELSSLRLITTEEQVLTLCNASHGFEITANEIFRIWTTVKKIDVPSNWQNYIFLHLPSEKSTGIVALFNFLRAKGLKNITRNNLIFELKYKVGLFNIVYLFFRLFSRKIYSKISNSL